MPESPSAPPEAIVAVDWSGAKHGAKRTIWLAEVRRGELVRLENGRGRRAVGDHLVARAAADPRLVVGFDFAFSFPAWFVRREGAADGPSFWRRAAEDGERWLEEADPPFYLRGRYAGEGDAHRATDLVPRPGARRRPETVFRLFGQTQVGKGSVRGMPVLETLRRSGFAVWPFDPPSWPMAIEIYPRLFYGQVAKTCREQRVAFLERYALPTARRDLAAATDDAFDAAVAALEMDRRRAEFETLGAPPEPAATLEGWIWS